MHATFIVPTTHRPDLLRMVLQSLAKQRVPPNWTCEIVVVGHPEDEGRAVIEEFASSPIRYLPLEHGWVTSKLNHGIAETEGDLILAADDDDIQSPFRLAMAVVAHQNGIPWSGSGEMFYHDLPTGRTARWVGEGRLVGTCINLTRSMVEAVGGGWPEVPSRKDGALAMELDRWAEDHERVIPFCDLGQHIGKGTVCLSHGAKMWQDMPWPAVGEVIKRGAFAINGVPFHALPDHAKHILRERRS